MTRTICVALMLAVLLGVLGGTLWRCVDCPECPAEGACVRCEDRHRITLLESRRRIPLHPSLRSMLRGMGYLAGFVGSLAESKGLSREQYLGWKGQREYFHYAQTTLVNGPDGPLVLTILSPKVSQSNDDSGIRVLLFDRGGRDLDCLDLSMPGVLSGLDPSLSTGPAASILIRAREHKGDDAEPGDRILLASRARTLILNRNSWPAEWKVQGVARIIPRDGRLDVTAP